MGFDRPRGFAPHSGDASGGGAIHQSSGDTADVDRSEQRDVLARAEASAPLPLDFFAADSGDVREAPLDFGRSAVLPARGL